MSELLTLSISFLVNIHLNNEFERYRLYQYNQEYFGGGHKIMTIVSHPAKENDNIQIYFGIVSFIL